MKISIHIEVELDPTTDGSGLLEQFSAAIQEGVQEAVEEHRRKREAASGR